VVGSNFRLFENLAPIRVSVSRNEYNCRD
jgi:hypothetical protein